MRRESVYPQISPDWVWWLGSSLSSALPLGEVVGVIKKKKKKTREGKNTFICSYSTDFVVGKQTREICMYNWDGVWCIQAHQHPHHTLLLQAMNPGWGERWKREAKPGLCYWPPSVYPPSFTPCSCVHLPTLQNPYQASHPPKTIICQQSSPIWCLLKRTVNSSLPSGELCKKKRISHLTAWLSPPLQTAAGHVISRPWPVQSWFGDRLIAGS